MEGADSSELRRHAERKGVSITHPECSNRTHTISGSLSLSSSQAGRRTRLARLLASEPGFPSQSLAGLPLPSWPPSPVFISSWPPSPYPGFAPSAFPAPHRARRGHRVHDQLPPQAPGLRGPPGPLGAAGAAARGAHRADRRRREAGRATLRVCRAAPRRAASCLATVVPYRLRSGQVQARPCHAAHRNATPHHAIPCHSVPRRAVPCHAADHVE